MNAWHWVAVTAAAWLVLSCAVGVTIGLVVRRRDALEATARLESMARNGELEASSPLVTRSILR